MVSTLDFESSDPSSNLGRTYIFSTYENFIFFSDEVEILENVVKESYHLHTNQFYRLN